MKANQGKAACCGQISRTGKAFTCLPNWVFGQTTANEKAVLLTLQFHAPNIHPSLGTLAKESGLSQRTVQRVLVDLEAKGWVAKEETATESGGRGVNRYQLLIWHEVESEAEAEPGTSTPWSQWPWGHGQADQGALVTVANKQEQSSNKRNPTALEPPLVPPVGGERQPSAVATDPCQDIDRGSDHDTAQAWPPPMPDRDRDGFLINPLAPPPPATAAAAPISPEPEPLPPLIDPEVIQATQPQPQQPNAPRPLPEPAQDPERTAPVNPKGQKRKAGGFQPVEGDVPAALLPVVRELLAFWACKGGKRTERAWSAQLGQLRQIQDDPAGGTEAVRAQLEAGARAAVFGKAWQAVTHANWERYGRRATPIIGTGFGRPTAMDTAARAMLLIRQREAKAKAEADAEADAMERGLVLAEVA